MRCMLLSVIFLLAVAISQPTYAITGTPFSYHYDAETGALIKNLGMANEESLPLGLSPFTWMPESSFAFRPDGLEVVYCYSSSYDPAQFTVVRRDLLSNTVLWERVFDGHRCGLGPGAYTSDGLSVMMGAIIFYPWDSPPLALGPFGFRYTSLSLADGSFGIDFDEFAMPALDESVAWLPITHRANVPGEFVFEMEPVAIEGGGFDGRVFKWDGGSIVTEMDAALARGSALHTPWGEVFWPAVEPSLPVVDSFIPYLQTYNVVRVSDASGGTTRTIHFEPDGVITQLDLIGTDGLRITYITNADEPAPDAMLFNTIEIYRDGAIALLIVDATAPPPVRVWTRPIAASVTPFPEIPLLGAPPLMPTPTIGAASAAGMGAFTYHYDFETQSLIRNYLIEEAFFPLGVPMNRSVMGFAIDRDGNNVIYCYRDLDVTPTTVTIVHQDIASGLRRWSRTVEAELCELGPGAYADDGSTFAMGLVYGFPWEPAGDSPYEFSYGLYSTATGALVNQLDLNYVPFSDRTESHTFETLSNTGSQTVFRAWPEGHHGPAGAAQMFAWDGGFNISPRANEAGMQFWFALHWPGGEVFWPDYDPALPGSDLALPFMETSNVVRYFRDGATRTIYTNPTQPIMDVDPWPGYGIRLTLITGRAEDTGKHVYSYLILNRDGGIVGPFGTVNWYPSLVWVRRDAGVPPPMPDFIVAAAAAPTPAAPPDAFTCPGFMPSRLTVGGRGRVTPGVPNNLRAAPDVTAARVGQIPGGAMFDVLSGPVCDPIGRAWWQVVYRGVTGWTVEGQGSEYYTEPVR